MAARQETSGKVRIQLFIENLLRRIALAETLLEDYQVLKAPTHVVAPLLACLCESHVHLVFAGTADAGDRPRQTSQDHQEQVTTPAHNQK